MQPDLNLQYNIINFCLNYKVQTKTYRYGTVLVCTANYCVVWYMYLTPIPDKRRGEEGEDQVLGIQL